ncbi:acyl-CoA dehydrogenase [Advenella kashmirensis W13003]|uniref:Acyl-CoA dehydrogenase n=1 Tax=Advenella kashmirensis W13003 TaxID=1424334 RepID=V8QRB0_9BURK|nr:acyl-CoA dehydrogenase family protein [Advenella kashmirensis]ETF01855.1 acyl-CoA dehydrogenase [Advenella kashmirensis W13003]
MLDEKTETLRNKVRHFIDTVAIPLENPALEKDVEALDAVCRQLRAQARTAGVYGPQLPLEWGGLGLNWAECAHIFEEAGRGMLGPLALNCAPPDQPNMLTLLHLATDEQKQTYLGPLARGEKRACFAMTEPAPGAGSDPNMLQTRATRRANGWLINGHKKFISGGVAADFAIVPAKTDEGVTLFIVDTDTKGYRVTRDIPTVTGYQIGGHAEILIENCHVPDSAVLGQIGMGMKHIQLRLEPARLSHCMRFIGRARRALEIAQDYVQTRHTFGNRLSELQQIQAMIADSHIDLHASRLMTRECAMLMDRAISVKNESAMTKIFVSEAVGRVADRCVQMMGALGVSDDTVVSCIWRESRPFRIYDGANELHRAFLARRILQASITP